VSFSAVGQAAQLTATAFFGASESRDVTAEAEWRSTDLAVATVSASGIVTIVGFGVTSIVASYASREARQQISAWPPGTFSASGRVREPGAGGIDRARVLDPRSGRFTLTDGQGRFTIGGLEGSQLTLDKEGYETSTVDVVASPANDFPLQRVIRLTAGETVTPSPLAPHDLSYSVGTHQCFPCRRVRVVSASTGTLQLTLRWTVSRAALNIWIGNGSLAGTYPELVVEVPVAVGELVLYVGMTLNPAGTGFNEYVPFTLTSVLR
jgi:hypothetical protein